MEKECDDEVKLLTYMFGMKLDTANKFSRTIGMRSRTTTSITKTGAFFGAKW